MKTKEIVVANMFVDKKSICKFKDFNTYGQEQVNKMLLLTGKQLDYRKDKNAKCFKFLISEPGSMGTNGLGWVLGITGYDELVGWTPTIFWIPESLVFLHKKGDVITFTLPITKTDFKDQIKSETTIKVSAKLIFEE